MIGIYRIVSVLIGLTKYIFIIKKLQLTWCLTDTSRVERDLHLSRPPVSRWLIDPEARSVSAGVILL